jgi:hypothetical protein
MQRYLSGIVAGMTSLSSVDRRRLVRYRFRLLLELLLDLFGTEKVWAAGRRLAYRSVHHDARA